MLQETEIDRTKLRYVLYARRSTTDEGSQVRSVPDQVKYCKRYALLNDLNVVAIIREKGSAKVAGKRDLFKVILKEIENGGKYDAIWHVPTKIITDVLSHMKHTFSVGGYAAYSLAVVYMISRDSVMILVGTCQCGLCEQKAQPTKPFKNTCLKRTITALLKSTRRISIHEKYILLKKA